MRISDWSSDVCSSDLGALATFFATDAVLAIGLAAFFAVFVAGAFFAAALAGAGFAALPAGLATAFFFVTGAFFGAAFFGAAFFGAAFFGADRKSTRLNSSP